MTGEGEGDVIDADAVELPVPKRKTKKKRTHRNRAPSHSSIVRARRMAQEGLTLRAEGRTWQQVSDEVMGADGKPYFKGHKGHAYETCMAELERQPPRAVRERLIDEMDSQIESMYAVAAAKAHEGDWEAARVSIRLLERRAKLLGLDAIADQLHVPIDNVQGLVDLLLALSMTFVPRARQAAWLDQVASAARQIEPGAR